MPGSSRCSSSSPQRRRSIFPDGLAERKGFNERFMKLGPTLYLLLGSVALLLLIGCSNVSILLLARGTAREHEFACARRWVLDVRAFCGNC